MSMKRIAIFILTTFILFVNIACSAQGGESTVGKQESKAGEAIPTISIYLMDYEKPYSNELRSYDGVLVKAKFFYNPDEFINKTTAEILAGEGPDIFKINKGQFSPMQKLMSSGVLADLDQLISEDSEFDLSQYQKTVADCGIYEGKRYLIPTGFSIPVFYTDRSILDKNDIKISPDSWDWEAMVELADNFIKENKGTGKYLFQTLQFMDLLKGSNTQFIDYGNKKSRFDSPEFIELLKIYKEKIYPAVCPPELDEKYASPQYSLLKNDKAVMMYNGWYGGPQYICGLNSVFSSIMGEDIEVYPVPSYNGGSNIIAEIGVSFGINSKCKYKEAAFKYIKTILSKEHHKKFYDFSKDITINGEAFEEELAHYSDSTKLSGVYSDGRNSFPVVAIPEKLTTQLRKLIGNIGGCEFTDRDIQGIINGEVNDYLNDKKTAEQAARTINDKVSIYLNE